MARAVRLPIMRWFKVFKENRMNKLIRSALSLAAVALLAAGAQAADFPAKDKVITIIVPFSAGGPTDRVARDLAEAMRKPLGGISVVVDNAAGAGGSIGANKVAKAPADGYTLLLHHIGMATMPTLVRNIPFKVESDFEYLGMVNDVPMTLIGKPALPANTYKELTGWIAQNKGSPWPATRASPPTSTWPPASKCSAASKPRWPAPPP
jgi:tripartite-type tricarboxylate transporter receptor subunit TctC